MECAEYQRPILFAAESTYVDTGMVGQMVGFTMMQVDVSELAVGSTPLDSPHVYLTSFT